jgi:hypothetical protein
VPQTRNAGWKKGHEIRRSSFVVNSVVNFVEQFDDEVSEISEVSNNRHVRHVRPSRRLA